MFQSQLDRTGAATPPGLRALYGRHRHLVNYLFIGGLASATDLAIFLVLFNIAGTSALFAHSVAVPTAVLLSFTINARHNFRTHDFIALRLMSFVVVCTIGYIAGYAVIAACAAAGLGANLGKFVSLPVVFAIQYLLNANITFRRVGGRA
ncbi:GtrA family protein [Limimaricola pyoseonensis]|uniref:Putative flippase GtrA (Transmembrane translocase of bactoprenol-linked glucose) n=1 Tax=Limimaricola pyoseonensis TaxID=521013 RepID=A0A1G7J2E9_9RHOB|nr:GtrA family protein [Limimaricola pyoseonensis]SDF18964.1 Putative flippase GtrA (transmembrane translocase of bactoprenol-linked glucose) [Limimaricola pyoseonensis]